MELASANITPWVAAQPEDLPKLNKHTKAKAARYSRKSEQICVKPETLSVIKQMHGPPNPNKSSVRWVNLVRTLVDAGFVAKKGAGSAVRFSSDEGCIDFHRPHPDPTVESIMLHAMRRRLRKWFGWDLGRFALRTKVEGANAGHRERAS